MMKSDAHPRIAEPHVDACDAQTLSLAPRALPSGPPGDSAVTPAPPAFESQAAGAPRIEGSPVEDRADGGRAPAPGAEAEEASDPDANRPDASRSSADAPDPSPDDEEARDLNLALRRGWKGVCPACGGGPLFDGYLTVRPRCVACGERMDGHRADDMPTWLTILVVGHIVAPLMLFVWEAWSPPLWVHWTIWPPLALLLSLGLLPRFKGCVVALQWARRMAGFAPAQERD